MATDTNQSQHLSSTAQQYLDIIDITNDLVILRDGSAGMVLELSAINFGLLSEPEQDAIIYAYAALINSLSFPIQIVISSRPKDVSLYLEYIDEQLNSATQEIRRRQISSYRQFVANLITEQNVLDKNFFVVISLAAIEVGVTSAGGLFSLFAPGASAPKIEKNVVVEKSINILGPRRDHLINQFARFGLRAQQLTTKELIHEFYVLYNGQSAEGAKIVDTREYTTPLIQTYSAQNSSPTTNASTPLSYQQAAATPGRTNTIEPVASPQAVAPAPVPVAPAPTVMPTPPRPAAEILPGTPEAHPSLGSSDQLRATPIPGQSPSPTPGPSGIAAAVAAIPTEGPGSPTNYTTQPR